MGNNVTYLTLLCVVIFSKLKIINFVLQNQIHNIEN